MLGRLRDARAQGVRRSPYLDALAAALQKPAVPGKPSLLLARTVKGKGVSFMENQVGWHGKAPNQDERATALRELEG